MTRLHVKFYFCMLVGITFWRCPRRKTYAVSRQDIEDISQVSRKRHHSIIDSDDDADFCKPKPKESGYNILEKKLNVLIDDVGELKNAISDMLTLNKEARIPLGLHRLLRDTLKCKICLSVPMTPPIIISRCCKTVVGCEKCVNEWYSGPDALIKTCPSCRAERGYNETMLLRGFDDFITEVQKVIQTQDERDNEELPAVTL